MMTTTVDIPEDVLNRTMRSLDAKSPQEAIVKALEQAGLRATNVPQPGKSQKDLLPFLGTFEDDEMMSPEELDRMRSQD